MKIPFDIKYRPQIENGEYKVETRDGNSVRIICWDKDGDGPIVALVTIYSEPSKRFKENIFQYRMDGCYMKMVESSYDLFIVTPEKELTEFEEALENFYNHHLQVCSYDNQGTVEDSLHDGASKLLALASKELESEIKAKVMQNLPRWNKTVFHGTYVTTFGGTSKFLVHDGYYLEIKDLEKLPGFKED